MSTLRERKAARLRLDLTAALRVRLDERTLDQITVRELCEAVEISDGTFFNHFPSKADLAFFFVQLWAIDAGWHAAQAAPRGARAAIEAIFDMTAAQASAHPRVMGEIIALQARMPPGLGPRPVSSAERALAFPGRVGLDQLGDLGLDSLLPPLIERAAASGELPASVDRQCTLLALCNVFFGVPLLLGPRAPQLIGAAYRQQLDLVWKGLRHG